MYLNNMIGGNPVKCKELSKSPVGEIVALCVAGEWPWRVNLNKSSVQLGNALATEKHGTSYQLWQHYAERLGVGIWKYQFILPSEWRAMMRQSDEQ